MPVTARISFGPMSDCIRRKMRAVIRRAANKIVQYAREDCPVDTGALQTSIHSVTSQSSGYEEAIARAHALLPNLRVYPKVAPAGPDTAIAAVAAEHGAINEFGGAHMAARPYFIPAVERVRAELQGDLAKAMRDCKEGRTDDDPDEGEEFGGEGAAEAEVGAEGAEAAEIGELTELVPMLLL